MKHKLLFPNINNGIDKLLELKRVAINMVEGREAMNNTHYNPNDKSKRHELDHADKHNKVCKQYYETKDIFWEFVRELIKDRDKFKNDHPSIGSPEWFMKLNSLDRVRAHQLINDKVLCTLNRNNHTVEWQWSIQFENTEFWADSFPDEKRGHDSDGYHQAKKLMDEWNAKITSRHS